MSTCPDRLTPYGGVAAWSHYLEKLGVVRDLAQRFPGTRTSPNATPVGDIVQAFMFNCLMGGRRFAHARRLQDDRAVAVVLGMKKERLCGEDAFTRLCAKVPKPHAYPPGESSPGRVTFTHETHLRARAGCVTCHPRLFGMKFTPPKPEAGMHAPSSCGACHDGKQLFGTEDPATCARCHSGPEAHP